jgi:hypothetical protein
MKLSKVYCIAFCLLISFAANAQGVFKRTFGATTGFNEGNSVVQMPDTGFLMVGAMSGFGGGASDIMMIKTDKNGVQQWLKPFGWANIEVGKNIKATNDGNYVICGYTNSFGAGGYDVLLVKITPTGETIWARTYGGADWDFGYTVCPTADGGYIVAGETYSFGLGQNDFYVVKTDADGVMQWQKTIGTPLADVGRSVVQTYDGTYVVVGYTTQVSNTNNNDVFFTRLDAQGDTLWTKRQNPVGDDYAFDVAQIPTDSSYCIVGHTNSFSGPLFDPYILHFTKDDVQLTANNMPSNGYSSRMYSCVARNVNGQLGITGETIPDFDSKPFGLMNLISPDAGYIWGFNFNINFQEEYFYQIINCFGDGFAMVGTSKSAGPGLSSATLMTVAWNAIVAPDYTVGVPEAEAGLKFVLYPNPSTGIVKFSLQKEAKNLSLIVYNAIGQEVFNKTYNAAAQVEEDFSKFENGFYQARITADGKYTTQTFVIAR